MRLLYLLTLVATTFLLHSRPYYIVDYRWTNDKAWNSEEHPGHFRHRYHSEDRGSRDTYGGGGGDIVYMRGWWKVNDGKEWRRLISDGFSSLVHSLHIGTSASLLRFSSLICPWTCPPPPTPLYFFFCCLYTLESFLFSLSGCRVRPVHHITL